MTPLKREHRSWIETLLLTRARICVFDTLLSRFVTGQKSFPLDAGSLLNVRQLGLAQTLSMQVSHTNLTTRPAVRRPGPASGVERQRVRRHHRPSSIPPPPSRASRTDDWATPPRTPERAGRDRIVGRALVEDKTDDKPAAAEFRLALRAMRKPKRPWWIARPRAPMLKLTGARRRRYRREIGKHAAAGGGARSRGVEFKPNERAST